MAGNRQRRAEKMRRRDAKRGFGEKGGPDDPGLPPESLQAGLRSTAADLAGGGTVSSWAEREGVRTEEAAVATVRLLASLT